MVGAVARHIRSSLIAYLALFVALSGSGYAARGLVLPDNSVGTRQLKSGAVTKTKIAKRTIAGLRGTRGPTGATGPQGAPGSDGTISGIEAGGALRGVYPSPRLRHYSITALDIEGNTITPAELAPPMPWVLIGPDEFEHGWHDRPGDPPAAYFVDDSGVIHLRGVISGGIISKSASGEAFFILCFGPDDSLPYRYAVDSDRAFGEVTVVAEAGCAGPPWEAPSGPGASVRVTAGSNVSVSLDGITWRGKYRFVKNPDGSVPVEP